MKSGSKVRFITKAPAGTCISTAATADGAGVTDVDGASERPTKVKRARAKRSGGALDRMNRRIDISFVVAKIVLSCRALPERELSKAKCNRFASASKNHHHKQVDHKIHLLQKTCQTKKPLLRAVFLCSDY